MKFREAMGELIEIEGMSADDSEWYIRGWVSRADAVEAVLNWMQDESASDVDLETLDFGNARHQWARWVPNSSHDEHDASWLWCRRERLPGYARVTVLRSAWLERQMAARAAAAVTDGEGE